MSNDTQNLVSHLMLKKSASVMKHFKQLIEFN